MKVFLVISVVTLLFSESRGQGPIRFFLNVSNERKNANFWNQYFSLVRIEATAGGVPRPGIYDGYDTTLNIGVFRLDTANANQISLIEWDGGNTQPFTVWPQRLEYSGLSSTEVNDFRLENLDDFLNNRKTQVGRLTEAAKFEDAANTLSAADSIFKKFTQSDTFQGVDVRFYRFQLGKFAVTQGRIDLAGRLFRAAPIEAKLKAFVEVEQWHLNLIQNAAEDLQPIVEKEDEYNRMVLTPLAARVVQAVNLWIEFSKSSKFSQLATAETRGEDLDSIWQTLHSDWLRGWLSERAKANLEIPELDALTKDRLNVYLKICEQPDVREVSMNDLQEAMQGLRWIFPDRAIGGVH